MAKLSGNARWNKTLARPPSKRVLLSSRVDRSGAEHSESMLYGETIPCPSRYLLT
jgi:hypothetical protein